MFSRLRSVSNSSPPSLRARVVAIYALLAVFNIGAWLWALVLFESRPSLLGIALVVYGLGLRHAVDADHIAAIDNVTRKLMQEGKRPVAVGFFFALGHSAVVMAVAAAVASAASALDSFGAFRGIGGAISTGVSAVFLLAIGLMNVAIFRGVYRSYRKLRDTGTFAESDLDFLLDRRGMLSRFFRPMFAMISKSWHMFPLGFLFGLGFDTATEVALFGVSATQLAQGVPFGAIMVFPVLFAAGMALVDTTDGVMMLGAYEWAFVKPMRKLYYNMTITLVSILVAFFIGGVEVCGLLADEFGLTGGFWSVIGALNGNFNSLGFAIIGLFVLAWVVSFAIYRAKGLDETEVARSI